MSNETTFRPPRTPLVEPGGIEHYVADLTVTASADVTLQSLQIKLAQQNQWLPIDGDPNLPLRTLVELNSTGPLRLGFGAWRDLLLGVQFKTKNGKLITAGARTMKNVAGYDLTKFMVGQRGLFGDLLTLTARTYKKPDMALHVKFEASDKKINDLLPTTSRPQWAMICEGFLFCGYLGDEKMIAFQETAVRTFQSIEVKRRSLQEDMEFRSQRWPIDGFRAGVPPTKILEFVQRANLKDYFADAAFGIIVGRSFDKTLLCKAADGIGGFTVFNDEKPALPENDLLKRLQSAFNG